MNNKIILVITLVAVIIVMWMTGSNTMKQEAQAPESMPTNGMVDSSAQPAADTPAPAPAADAASEGADAATADAASGDDTAADESDESADAGEGEETPSPEGMKDDAEMQKDMPASEGQ